MLLVIDAGNTNIVIGVYKEDKLEFHWRISTKRGITVDEMALLIHNLFHLNDLDKKLINGCIISNVVPSLSLPMKEMTKILFNFEPVFVEPGIKTGISILYDNPKEVGADRIVNAVGAYDKYKDNIIVVDFGTATTLDCITKEGEYLGGIISPGVMISAEALFKYASKLPKVEVKKPKKVLGKNTTNSIQSGLYYGYISLVDGLVDKLKAELKWENPKVIGTGGLAKIISKHSTYINEVDPLLTLEGLKIIFEMNKYKIYRSNHEFGK